MIPYRLVKSSWVEGFGFDSSPGHSVLYVGTQGKYYEVVGLSDGDIQNLQDTVKSGKSVGAIVGKLFQKGKTAPVEWEAVLAAVGSVAQQTAQSASSASAHAGKVLRSFADFLLPQARTGLFSFHQ